MEIKKKLGLLVLILLIPLVSSDDADQLDIYFSTVNNILTFKYNSLETNASNNTFYIHNDLVTESYQTGNILINESVIDINGNQVITSVNTTWVIDNQAYWNDTDANFNNLEADNIQTDIINSSRSEDKSLVLHLEFNGNVNDSSQYKNDGTNYGVDLSKDVAEFDGDDYIDLGDDSSLSITDAITVGAWIYWKEYTASSAIISKYSQTYMLGYQPSDDGKLHWHIYTDAWAMIPVSVPKNEWHYLVGTYDKNLGSNQMKIYLDGKFIDNATQTGSIDTQVGNNLGIGVYYIGKPSPNYFNGIIDEVKIYNRALGLNEIQRIYNEDNKNYGHFNNIQTINLNVTGVIEINGNQVITSVNTTWVDDLIDIRVDLTFLRNLLDTVYATISDLSTYLQNNTDADFGIVDTTTTLADTLTLTAPLGTADIRYIKGGYLNLDGDDVVVVADDNSLDMGTGDFTYSAWIRTEATSFNYIFDKGYGDGNRLVWGHFSGGSVGFRIQIGGVNKLTGISASDGEWHHLVITRTGTTLNQYLDGEFDSTDTSSADITNAITLIIGARGDQTTSFWIGDIDELIISNRSYNQEDVTALYNQGRNPGVNTDPDTVTHFTYDLDLSDGKGVNDGSVGTGSPTIIPEDWILFGGNQEISGFVDRGNPLSADWTQTTLTADGGWHDLDLSGIVPAGAKAVLLQVTVQGPNEGDSIFIRKKGNTGGYNRIQVQTIIADKPNYMNAVTSIDGDRKVEYALTNVVWTILRITVQGWWF